MKPVKPEARTTEATVGPAGNWAGERIGGSSRGHGRRSTPQDQVLRRLTLIFVVDKVSTSRH
jgi:hypothetical protein